MAAVINTSDDLLKLLAENAEFYQAVRRLILTDEPVEPPERFARFADRATTFLVRKEMFDDARYVVGVLFGEIPAHLGFTYKGTLMRRDLNDLIGPQGRTAGVSSDDRQGFVRADLVVAATDADGDTHYIAVEASYTANERDTRRARRNAELLARLTGQPAHAVIASVHNVAGVEAEIDAGAIHWYALDPKDFTPE